MKYKNYPKYQHQELDNIRELLNWTANQYGDKIAFSYEQKHTVKTISYGTFKEQVLSLGTYLYSKGYHNKCHIAVIGENSYEWIQAYFAVVCGGNVIVPLDKDFSAQEISEKLKDSGCCLLILPQDYSEVIELLNESNINTITMNYLAEMTKAGDMLRQSGNIQYEQLTVQGSDLASIVYTSGTTGKHKGVMLTHGNFMSDTLGAAANVYIEGTGLLILPLHHTFGLVASLFAGLYYGTNIYINQSLRKLASDINVSKPNYMFTVPLLVEQLYRKIWGQAKKQGKDRLLRIMMHMSDCLLKIGIDLRHQLFSSVHESLGGRLSLIISGGAFLEEKYIKDFDSLGITLLNGYGITECAPVVAVNRNKCIIPGSVGFPLICNNVRIADDGEILVRGKNVMSGYYDMESETSQCLIDGWFHTGDLGKIDQYGALHITGRKKNLIILSNGENIAAEELESIVKSEIPYILEVIAFEMEGKIAIEVYLDPDAGEKREQLEKDIAELNRRLPAIKHISNVMIRDQEFLKTTTKKIIRSSHS